MPKGTPAGEGRGGAGEVGLARLGLQQQIVEHTVPPLHKVVTLVKRS